MSELAWRADGTPPFERSVAETADAVAVVRPLANANGSGFDWTLQARTGDAWLTGWAPDEATARQQAAAALSELRVRMAA